MLIESPPQQQISDQKPIATTKTNNLYNVLSDGRWEFFLDHHMLAHWQRCPRLFALSHIPRIYDRSNGGEESEVGVIGTRGRFPWYTSFGIWWSDVMSDFYELMKAGSLTKQLACIQAAVRWEENKMDEYAAIEPWDYQAFGGGMYNPITLSDGTTIKVPSGAIIMTAAYYDRWAQIDNDQWKILATESGFGLNREVKLGETDEVVVYYTGRPDLVAMESHTGLVVVCDHKTSSAVEGRFLQRFKPHDQFPGYIFAVRELLKDIGLRDRQAGRFLVNGAARKKPPETSKAKVKPEWFRRFEIPYVESELEEWRQATLHRVEDIQMAIKTDYFEGRTASCHSPGECNFVRVCSQPPEKRLIILKSEFLVKEPWKPYKKEEKCQTTGSNQYSQQAV